MTSRMTKDQYFMKMALLTSEMSTCPRRKVGCIIVNKNKHIIATGYNGVPKGFPHCIDKPCGGENFKSGEGLSKCMATHAEQNALLQCPNTMDIDTIYVTASPCETCSKLIANTSCKRIVFLEFYPGTPISMLGSLKIETLQLTMPKEDGYRSSSAILGILSNCG